MNKFFTIVGVLWLSAQGAFAQGQMNYFSGQEIEAGKPVQLVGAVRNSENLERENQIGKIVEINRGQLRYCYERMLASGAIAVDSTIYFLVDGDGVFGNVTADFKAVGKDAADLNLTKNLFACVSHQVSEFRATQGTSDHVFRFKVRFESAR